MMMGVSIIGCSGDQKWKEEVQLSDGHIIVVERELLTEGGGDEWAINRSGSKPKEYRIRFEYPEKSGQEIEWHSIKQKRTWPELPLIFDVENGKPVVFSNFYDSVGCQIYLKYVYQDGVWTEEMLPPVFEQHTTNLFLKFSAGLSSVNLKTKQELNSDVGFRHIQQVGPKHPYCN
jgi:hypothetical protein